MDPATSQSMMQEQLDELLGSGFCKTCNWKLQVDGLVVSIAISPRQNRDTSFTLFVDFNEFPRRAPSYNFNGDWPSEVKHGAKPPGICTPGTREFYEHYHKNDKQYPWDHNKQTVLMTEAEIQRMMEKNFKG